MGCDIHIGVERLNDDKEWEYLSPPEIELYKNRDGSPYMAAYWYFGRNYSLFAALANVRNGIRSYFNEPATGNYIEPISEPRGIPDDASKGSREYLDSYGVDGHSHTWFTLRELVQVRWDELAITHAGLVSENEYLRYKRDGAPHSWSGGIGGGGIRIVDNAEMDRVTAGREVLEGVPDFAVPTPGQVSHYTRIEWQTTLRDSIGSDWFDFLDRLRVFTRDDGSDVRVVMFFDN